MGAIDWGPSPSDVAGEVDAALPFPQFPDFRPVAFADQGPIAAIGRSYEPYSDFAFSNLWAWDIDGSARWCFSGRHLVTRHPDCVTGEPYLSFLGCAQADDTAKLLLDFARSERLHPLLRRVPKVSVDSLSSRAASGLAIAWDEGGSDYVFDLRALASYQGRGFHGKRKAASRLRSRFGPDVVVDRAPGPALADEMMRLFDLWVDETDRSIAETIREREALTRVLSNASALELVIVGLRVAGTLAGFSVFELLPHAWATAMFSKVSRRYVGVMELLRQESAGVLLSLGCLRLNSQMDLGLPGLRAAKRAYRPVGMLDKFTVGRLAT